MRLIGRKFEYEYYLALYYGTKRNQKNFPRTVLRTFQYIWRTNNFKFLIVVSNFVFKYLFFAAENIIFS